MIKSPGLKKKRKPLDNLIDSTEKHWKERKGSCWYLRAKKHNKSLQLKIGGKDKDRAVCFKNELFVGKKPKSLFQTVQDENDWKPREDKTLKNTRLGSKKPYKFFLQTVF